MSIRNITIANTIRTSLLDKVHDIIVIGGGLAGLTSANLLSRSGLDVVLIEKKEHPFHRVCGEYVSNEVRPFLEKNGLYPEDLGPADINKLQLSSVSGSNVFVDLALGGFGISRYSFDQFLAQKATGSGCKIVVGIAENIIKKNDVFETKLQNGDTIYSKLAIGSFGKNSQLDRNLNRSLTSKNPTYLAVKYHIRADLPENVIALHNFSGGYCGVSRIENGLYNLCYLTETRNLIDSGDINQLEEDILYQNPLLKRIFQQSERVFERPLTISKITFSKKDLVSKNVLMCGDAAGMIVPLCGNGMAMAIHSAKILSELIVKNLEGNRFDSVTIHDDYCKQWKSNFSVRLSIGRKLQYFFGKKLMSEIAVRLLKTPFAESIINLTHGNIV
ncbi:MAG: NAD(P)/FAD-dependent oxidoreductase [Bacteroidetes bacterium]|nr:NAD(P)/FAD-dependent oxidoreductase [Bacteroidota bacterium]MDA1119353.1 NAD(P)/FAD-dependent oxidoreductase [Bacteroidota bacterium]